MSNDVEANALVNLSLKCSDHGQIITLMTFIIFIECPRNELYWQEMAEALHREVEELKGVLDAEFAFIEATKVCMC